jgi:hypothetical protein
MSVEVDEDWHRQRATRNITLTRTHCNANTLDAAVVRSRNVLRDVQRAIEAVVNHEHIGVANGVITLVGERH